MSKRWSTTLLAVLLCLVLTGCSTESILSSLPGSSGKWVDSDLIGSIGKDDQIREQDDFAAAVNASWKLKQGDKYYGTFQEIRDAVTAKKKQIVTDPSIPGDTADCLRSFYQLASDWNQRDKEGIEPLKAYIEDISSIDSMEGLYDFFADPERNPLYLSPVMTKLPYVMHLGVQLDSYAVYFTAPELSLAVNDNYDTYFSLDSKDSFDRYERIKEKALYLLGRLGISEGDALSLINKCMAWEKKVAEADNKEALSDLDDITYSLEEAAALTGDFPFEKIVSSWGFKDTVKVMINPQYARKLGRLCRIGNLDSIKAFLIVNYCLKSSIWLDRAAYDKMADLDNSRIKEKEDYGETDEQKEEDLLFNTYIGRTPMVGAMNRVYVENFFDEGVLSELTEVTQDVIRSFSEIFSEEEWLSEEGKAACLDKLDAIKIHIAYQDFDSVDYGKLHFKSADEGGSILEAWFAALRFEMDHVVWLADQTYDASYWDPLNQDLSTTMTNAVYNPASNGIYIYAGICEAPIYTPDSSYEEKLGCLFTIVGHEITHGFDKDGSQYDKEGIRNPWLPDTDRKAFNDRNDKVGTYYSTLRPFVGASAYNGHHVSGEATADMGGLKVTLHLAGEKPDFDYDKYFRAFANMWKLNVSLEKEKINLKGDPHPLAFYRVNVGLQQFDEFCETYGIKEGDGMYVKPGDRIKVW